MVFSVSAWPSALRHAAMHLGNDDGVIEHVAAIADPDILHDLDLAGARIDLDLGDMTAVRE